LSAGSVICCPQAALSVVRRQRYLLFAGGVGRSISRYTLLVKVAVFKSFRACHFSYCILTHSCSTALSMMRKQRWSTVTEFYSDGSHIPGPGFPGVCGILDTASLQVFPHPLAPRDDSLRARWRPQVFDRILRCRLVFGVTTRKTLPRTAPVSSRVQMSRPCLSV